MRYLRMIITIFFLLPFTVHAATQMGEATYTYYTGTETAYVDYVVSDNQLLGTHSRSFIYGSETDYQASAWFYFYQIEESFAEGWDDPGSYSPYIEFGIRNISEDNILSAGFVDETLDFDVFFNHFLPGEKAEDNIIGGEPNFAYFFPDYCNIPLKSSTIGSYSPILFISSTQAPTVQESVIYSHFGTNSFGSFGHVWSATSDTLLAPQAVPEPVGLFLVGMFILSMFRKKLRK